MLELEHTINYTTITMGTDLKQYFFSSTDILSYTNKASNLVAIQSECTGMLKMLRIIQDGQLRSLQKGWDNTHF